MRRTRRLRKVTVNLEQKVARWLRREAARRETTVSCLVAAILKERVREELGYESAMRRALRRKPFLNSSEGYLSRQEVHRRSTLPDSARD